MTKLRKGVGIIGLIILLFAISMFSTYFSAAKAQNEVVFRVGWDGTSFDTFNPFTTYAQVSGWATTDVYDSLVRFNKDYASFTPDLADSWEVNQTTAVFHLVHNATFQDGVKITADDVKFSFELAMKNWSRLEPNVEMIQSIKVLDTYTVKFTFKPTALFMSMAATAIPIVPKHIWQNVSDPATYNDYPLVGSGPFKVTNYKEGQYIQLEKNPNFFRTSWIPKVDKVIIEFYSDVPSAAQALRAGDIDAVAPTITPTDADQMKNNPNININVAPAILYYYLAFNVYPEGQGNPTLRDKVVRKALAHAINITECTLLAWHGYAKPLYTVLPSSNAFHDPNIQPYGFNLTLAAQMLDKAGYHVDSSGVRESPNGTKMKYTILVPSSMPEAIRVAQQIASWWQKINVKAEVQAMDTGSMAAIIWAKENNTIVPKHDIDLWDWFANPGDPTLLSIFLSNQLVTGTSDSGYVNPQYDKLYHEMLTAATLDDVKNIAWQLQEILHEDLPYLPLYEVSALQAYNNKFTGFGADWPGGPFGGYDWTTFLKVQLTQSGGAGAGKGKETGLLMTWIALAIIVIVIVVVVIILLKRK